MFLPKESYCNYKLAFFCVSVNLSLSEQFTIFSFLWGTQFIHTTLKALNRKHTRKPYKLDENKFAVLQACLFCFIFVFNGVLA